MNSQSLASLAAVGPNSSGLCMCGCGRHTRLAPGNLTRLGWVRGQPIRFIEGHGNGRPIADRFWPKVQNAGGCHLWIGFVGSEGYGEISYRGRRRGTHCVAWEMANGPIPAGQVVRHRCEADYPPGDLTCRRCVRLDHLLLGAPADNSADAVANGRIVGRPGEANPPAVLTSVQVEEVWLRAWAGENQRELAEEFGIDRSSVSKIKHGHSWQILGLGRLVG